jgi:hypothetical protein
MNYSKPQIVHLGTAIECMRGKKGVGLVESAPEAHWPSVAAHEADE